MNLRLLYFQIQMEFKGKSKRLTQAASNKTFTNKPSQNQCLGLCVNCKLKRIVSGKLTNRVKEPHLSDKSFLVLI